MSLYTEWNTLFEDQDDESFKKSWTEYCDAETKIYGSILATPEKKPSGTLEELYKAYEVAPVMFMGFLDGIQSSLNKPFDIEALEDSSKISLDIDMEKLFFNMLVAEADYLYGLPQWENVLSAEKREEIIKTYKRSKTVVKDETPGRNDPCSCGSGKKYKKCCGAN